MPKGAERDMNLKIRDLEAADAPVIAACVFIIRSYVRFLNEQAAGARWTLVTPVAGEFVGYLDVIWCRPIYTYCVSLTTT